MMPVSAWKELVRGAFDAALVAGHPAAVTLAAMRRLETPPTAVIAIGKAGASMAGAVREAGCKAPGLIVTTDESHAEIDGMQTFASAHPVPDARGLVASAAVTELVTSLGEDDHLLLLISGGGSALLPAPANGLGLADKQALNEALLASGLDIHDMNAVRRLFSSLKGGRLARLAAPARITQFLLSDVPGDRLESIASGPAIADPVPLEDTLGLVAEQGLDRLDVVRAGLALIRDGNADLPVRPGDPVMANVTSHLLASNDLCRAAARAALSGGMTGLHELDLPPLVGEAAACARTLADRLAAAAADTGSGVWGVTGGETTVQLGDGGGMGGRAQEMGVAFASAMHQLAPRRQWAALIAGTDGRDGPTDAAGALITSEHGFDMDAAATALARHDSHPFLESCHALLRVAPTGTNLGDIAIFIVAGEA
ncbi:glycerate kinase [Alphaproteobacteria bacterium LSUCC0719]